MKSHTSLTRIDVLKGFQSAGLLTTWDPVFQAAAVKRKLTREKEKSSEKDNELEIVEEPEPEPEISNEEEESLDIGDLLDIVCQAKAQPKDTNNPYSRVYLSRRQMMRVEGTEQRFTSEQFKIITNQNK